MSINSARGGERRYGGGEAQMMSCGMGSNLNRRDFLGVAGAAALAPGLTHNAAWAARRLPKGPLLKTIPSTGEKIPAVGMGSWRTFDVGANKTARAQCTEVLKTFFELGGGVVDSSPMYGSSQAVIGHALSRLGRPASLFSADKVWIGDGAAGPEQISTSATNWGVGRFDLLQVHNLVSWRAHLETLFAMKEEGRLRYVGVTSYAGLRYDEIASIVETRPVDFIQATYNLADREAERRLLPLALEKGVAVIANRPFREGALIDAVMRRPLPAMAVEIGAANWAQYLLKFTISHPALTVAIPATRRVDHMHENMGALTGPIPDAEMRAHMIAEFENG